MDQEQPITDPKELEHAVHRAKSYSGKALLTFILYFVGFYVVGVIANFIFLSEANKSKRLGGENPSGRGFLVFMVCFMFYIPMIIGVLVFMVFLFATAY